MYRRSQEIEQRLEELIELIRKGKHSAPAFATGLGISRPTVSRCLTALRQRGYVIRSVRNGADWACELAAEPDSTNQWKGGP